MYSHRKDHVSVLVNETFAPDYDTKTRRSCWRWWNQLSRLQRSLLYIIVVIAGFTLLYSIPTESTATTIVDERLHLNDVKKDAFVLSESNKLDEINHIRDEILKDSNRKNVIEEPAVEEQPDSNNNNHDDRNQNAENNNVNQIAEPPQTNVHFAGPTNDRQKAVIASFKHAWKGYKAFAWGHDHLKPISGGSQDWFGLGLTIIDSLDTMYIMGLRDEYAEAREWVANHLKFDINRDVNLFEITIRVLGGLLSIYHLSGDRMYLEKAVDLGERLLPCFESESGVPYSDVNLATRKAHAPKWSPDSSTSEVTTIQLEFRDLSRSTGDSKFENAVSKVSVHVHGLEKNEGLVPIFINANTGLFRSYSTITLGARGDSYYEYLLKQWIQTGKKIDYLRDDYVNGINGVIKLLARRTSKNKLLFIGELLAGGKDFKPKMDHLTCYLPGTLALGVHNGMPKSHMELADDLLYTCYQTYALQPTFLAPEITYFNIQEGATSDMYVKTNDAHSLLRPEFIESLWYMHQLKTNRTYQDWGWQIFQGFEKYTKVTNGYTSIGNVRNELNTRPKDMMESFFLSETLKYLYLLFGDNPKEIDLDKYVINSEAHPLPIHVS